MTETKVKEFSACQIQEINSFLSSPGIKYVDLKVVRVADALLLLIYEEDDLDLLSGKRLSKTLDYLTNVLLPLPSRIQDAADAISNLSVPARI